MLAHCEAHSLAHLLSLFIISIHLNVWLHLIDVSCRTPLIGLDQSYMWCSDPRSQHLNFSVRRQWGIQHTNLTAKNKSWEVKAWHITEAWEQGFQMCLISAVRGEGKLMHLSLLSKGMLQFNKCGREFAVLYSFLCSLLMVVLVCNFAHWQRRKVNVMYMQSRS